MKKGIIIALCSLAIMFAACKPDEPAPVDYAPNYVGDYLGTFTLTITSMNNQPQTGMTFPIDNIGMLITKGEEINVVTATVTVENEVHDTNGTATSEKIDFGTIPLTIDKPDQNYWFKLDLKMEGTKAVSDTLDITGSFTGNGSATIMGQEQIFNEVSGTLIGKLVSQSVPENL